MRQWMFLLSWGLVALLGADAWGRAELRLGGPDGLSWQEAKPLVGKPGWEGELEANRLEMYAFGSWGVPSFRLLDAAGHEVLGLWGQDRLWLFSREIQRLLGQAKGAR